MFIECSNDIDDIYENIERMRNANGERKVLIIFNGMNADMLSNWKPQQIVKKWTFHELREGGRVR